MFFRLVQHVVLKAGPESVPHSGTISGDMAMRGNTNRPRFPVPESEPQNATKHQFRNRIFGTVEGAHTNVETPEMRTGIF